MGNDCFWHAPLLKSLYAPKLTKRPANLNIEHITSDLDEKGLELFSKISQSMDRTKNPEAEANQADKKGISAKLTPAADMGQGKAPKKQSAPNSTFQKKLQDRHTL